MYKYGENPDVLIFNKVFVAQDYKFPKHFENITILDICDPMWLEGNAVVETCQAMDAVVCPTEALATFIRQFHKNVVVIPDRFDLEPIPAVNPATGDARKVVWFGYSHNVESLKPAMSTLKAKGLQLTIISNDNPEVQRWGIDYTFVKYDESTIYRELLKHHFAILPDGSRPQDKYKSNNKEIKANLAGIPVAKTIEDVELYMDGKNRLKWFNTNHEIIEAQYDVKESVKQYKDLIHAIKSN